MTVLPWGQLKLVKPCISKTPEFKNNNKVNREKQPLWKYFDDKGLTVQDLPKAIICHEIIGILIMALTWSTCYYFPPSQNILLKEPIARLTSVLPRTFTEQIHSNPFLNSRLGSSYLESSCLRRLIRPVALPVKLYLTYRLVRAIPNINVINTADHPAELSDTKNSNTNTELLSSEHKQNKDGIKKENNSNIKKKRRNKFLTTAWFRGGSSSSGGSSISAGSCTMSESITIDIQEAAELYRSYTTDIHYNNNIDTQYRSRIGSMHDTYCHSTMQQPCRSVQYRLSADTSTHLADSI